MPSFFLMVISQRILPRVHNLPYRFYLVSSKSLWVDPRSTHNTILEVFFGFLKKKWPIFSNKAEGKSLYCKHDFVTILSLFQKFDDGLSLDEERDGWEERGRN